MTEIIDYYTCPCCKYRISELQYTQANHGYECIGIKMFGGEPQRCVATLSDYYPVFKIMHAEPVDMGDGLQNR